MKKVALVVLVLVNFYLYFVHEAEAISFEPNDCVQSFTPCSYLKQCLDRKEFIRAFRFARSEANKENAPAEIFLELSKMYKKGLGTEKNATKARHFETKYFQAMGVDSAR